MRNPSSASHQPKLGDRVCGIDSQELAGRSVIAPRRHPPFALAPGQHEGTIGKRRIHRLAGHQALRQHLNQATEVNSSIPQQCPGRIEVADRAISVVPYHDRVPGEHLQVPGIAAPDGNGTVPTCAPERSRI